MVFCYHMQASWTMIGYPNIPTLFVEASPNYGKPISAPNPLSLIFEVTPFLLFSCSTLELSPGVCKIIPTLS